MPAQESNQKVELGEEGWQEKHTPRWRVLARLGLLGCPGLVRNLGLGVPPLPYLPANKQPNVLSIGRFHIRAKVSL